MPRMADAIVVAMIAINRLTANTSSVPTKVIRKTRRGIPYQRGDRLGEFRVGNSSSATLIEDGKFKPTIRWKQFCDFAQPLG